MASMCVNFVMWFEGGRQKKLSGDVDRSRDRAAQFNLKPRQTGAGAAGRAPTADPLERVAGVLGVDPHQLAELRAAWRSAAAADEGIAKDAYLGVTCDER